MKAASAMGSLVVLSFLGFWSQAGVAQHHPAATHHPAAPAHTGSATSSVHSGMAQPTAAQQKQMQQQMQAMMQEEMKQQAAMLKMHQQMHDEHMKKFREWASSHGMEGSAGGLPSSPAAMQQWLNTQKHNKSLKKSYDPAYDEYLAFQKGAHTKNHAKTAEKHARVVATIHHNVNPALVSSNVSVSLLKTVHMKLQMADHDYDGHRMRAVQHVGSALHHLGASGSSGNGNTNAGAGSTMAQSQSDLILRDSLIKLRTAHNQLAAHAGATPSGTTGAGGTLDFGGARGAVSAAIHELDVALTVR